MQYRAVACILHNDGDKLGFSLRLTCFFFSNQKAPVNQISINIRYLKNYVCKSRNKFINEKPSLSLILRITPAVTRISHNNDNNNFFTNYSSIEKPSLSLLLRVKDPFFFFNKSVLLIDTSDFSDQNVRY